MSDPHHGGGPQPYVLIVHDVADYPAWKAIFDDAAGIRAAAGERSYQVMRADDDPLKVVHLSRWNSLSDARAFFESPELEVLRARAGVAAPTFLYLEQVDAGVLGAL